jgi:uracil-DNA glycosylase
MPSLPKLGKIAKVTPRPTKRAHKESSLGPSQAVAEHALPGQILPLAWRPALLAEVTAPYFTELLSFVAAEREKAEIFPPDDQVLTALKLTPLAAVRVVILGQDPYHRVGQAHGLAFSVPPGEPPPPSLRNIFKELHSDLGVVTPEGAGCLSGWAEQGVLLLNTVLTVRAGEAGSHKGQGWEKFTDAIIQAVAALPVPPVFVLWGGPAQAKAQLLDPARHVVIKSAHPSPLSAWGGFFGSRPFSAVNQVLCERGQEPIDWSLVR